MLGPAVLVLTGATSCLVAIDAFGRRGLGPAKWSLLWVSVFLLLAGFNVLVLAGRYSLPFFGGAVGVPVAYSVQGMGILALVELLLALLAFSRSRPFSLRSAAGSFARGVRRVPLPGRRAGLRASLTLGASSLIIGPQLWELASQGMPTTDLVWAYHALTQELLSLGVFPTTMLEYGSVVPFNATYVGYNLLGAFFYSVLGLNDVTFLMVMTVVVTALTFAFALAFFDTLVPFPYALGTTTLLMSMKLFIYKMSTFRTEALAVCFMFMALWLSREGVRRSDNRLTMIGGLALAAQVTTDAAIAAVGLSMLTSITLADLLLKRSARGVRPLLLFCATGVLATLAVFGLAVGEIPVVSSLAPHFQAGSDPTWGFLQALGLVHAAAPSFPADYMPGYLLLDVRDNLPFLAALSLAGLLVLWFRKNSRREILSMILFVSLITLIGVAFFSSSHAYVPGRSGFQRVFPYVYVAFAFTPFVILKSLPRLGIRSGPGRPAELPYKQVCALAIIGLVFLGNAGYMRAVYNTSMPAQGYQAMVWLRNNTSSNATFITNEWASGAAAAISQRSCLDDGDAPYLRTGAVTAVNSLIEQSKDFFLQPQANLQFLREHNVSYVVYSMNRALGGVPLAPESEANGSLFLALGFHVVYESSNIWIYSTGFANTG